MTTPLGHPPEPLAGWIPVDIDTDAAPPTVRWMRCTGLDFGLPFFDTSVDAYRALGPTEECLTDLDAVVRAARAVPGLSPNGFLFHTGRCGSTVLANMWLALPDPIVLKSVQPIDAVLRHDLDVDSARRDAWLTAVMTLLGQPLRGTERSCWHKLTSWNLADHARIRRLFPQTPCFFVYRHPLECVVGWLRRLPRMWKEPVPGLSFDEMPHAEYFSRLLASHLRHGLALVEAGAELGNYSELHDRLVPRFLAHFGIPWTDAMRAHVAGELRVNAKRRGQVFVPDSDEKRRASPDELAAVERWAMAPYEALERVRLARWPATA